MKSIDRLAIHESCHAVIGCLLGHQPVSVSIDPKLRGGKCCFEREAADPATSVKISLAGSMGEMLLGQATHAEAWSQPRPGPGEQLDATRITDVLYEHDISL